MSAEESKPKPKTKAQKIFESFFLKKKFVNVELIRKEDY